MSQRIDIIERDLDPERWAHAVGTIMSLCADMPKCHEVLSLPWLETDASIASILFIAYPAPPIQAVVPRGTLKRSFGDLIKSLFGSSSNRVAPDRTVPLPEPTAFLLVSQDDDVMVLDDMFSVHSGGVLLQRFLAWAKQRPASLVMLHALPNAVGFYMRYGFKFSTPDGQIVDAAEVQPLSPGQAVPADLHERLVQEGVFEPGYSWYNMTHTLHSIEPSARTLRSFVRSKHSEE